MTKTALQREKTGSSRYAVADLGYNYHMNEVQAALGISQLTRVDAMNRMRAEDAVHYNAGLRDQHGITIPTPLNCERQTHHLYVVRLLKEQYGISRDVLFEKLASKAVGLSVYYVPLPHSRTTGGKHNIGRIPCG